MKTKHKSKHFMNHRGLKEARSQQHVLHTSKSKSNLTPFYKNNTFNYTLVCIIIGIHIIHYTNVLHGNISIDSNFWHMVPHMKKMIETHRRIMGKHNLVHCIDIVCRELLFEMKLFQRMTKTY